MNQDSVKSLMSSTVISILPETPVLTAIDIILTNNFNGIPVTDTGGVLVGIITKYDLISKRGSLRDDTKVNAVMNVEPLTLNDDASVEDAVRAFSEHHKVDPIPVLDKNRRVVGVISRYDMVKLFKEYGISFASEFKNNPSSVNKKAFPFWIYPSILIALGLVVYILSL